MDVSSSSSSSSDPSLQTDRQRTVASACLGLLLLLFSANFVLRDSISVFGLVPLYTVIAKSYVWNVVTSSFYESDYFKLTVDILLLLFTVKPFKIAYSIDQFLLYFIISTVLVALASSTHTFFRFFVTRIEETLVHPTYGFGGAYILIIMYCRQQYKSEPIFSFFPGLTYHNLPVLTFTTQLIFWFCGLAHFVSDIKFTFLAILIGWSYLRFFYKFDDTSDHLGDHSDDFCFVGMFPSAIRRVIVPFSTAFYNLFVLLGLFPEGLEQLQSEKKKSSNFASHHLRFHNPEEASSSLVNTYGINSGDDQSRMQSGIINQESDAKKDRQRAIARKLLNAKLAELSNLSKEAESWDDENTGKEGDLSPSGGSIEASSSSSTLFTRQASADLNSSFKV